MAKSGSHLFPAGSGFGGMSILSIALVLSLFTFCRRENIVSVLGSAARIYLRIPVLRVLTIESSEYHRPSSGS